ncbi:MAG: FG-GAP repeat protein, partial [Thermoplasmata archaeon]|nr:FG-GAP repeat protein [Thermoplasmata archaeon]
MNGNGITNGLRAIRGGMTNGNGLTNGLRPLRPMALRKNLWKVALIPAVTTMLLLTVVFANVAYFPPMEGISIDGDFSDWDGIPQAETSTNQAPGFNPNVDITSTAVQSSGSWMRFCIKVSGNILMGEPSGRSDNFHIFIDSDGSNMTGYAILGIGADRMISIYGMDGAPRRSTLYTYNDPIYNDMPGWMVRGAVKSASIGDSLEVEVSKGLLGITDSSVVLFHSISGDGWEDFSDGATPASQPFLWASFQPAASPVCSEASNMFGTIILRAGSTNITMESIAFTQLGSSTNTGQATLEWAGQSVSAGVSNGLTTFLFPQGLTITQQENLSLVIRASPGTGDDGRTLGFTIGSALNIVVNHGIVSLRHLQPAPGTDRMGYVRSAPSSIIIDGAFEDWKGHYKRGDDVGDGTGQQALDITSFSLVTEEGQAKVYVSTGGEMLTGTLVAFSDRPDLKKDGGDGGDGGGGSADTNGTPIYDSDRDGIPDNIDTYPSDYDNDGIPDLQDMDDDGDGIPDGQDLWLGSFYLGSVTKRIPPGMDYLYAYFDIDNSTDTGFHLNYGSGMGVEYRLVVSGREGRVLSSILEEYTEGGWEERMEVAAEAGAREMEASLGLTDIGDPSDLRVFIMSTSWEGGEDSTSKLAALIGRGARSNEQPTIPWYTDANDQQDDTSIPSFQEIDPTEGATRGQDLGVVADGNGTTAGNDFGWNISWAGDVDNDGYDDIIVGAPGNNSDKGTAYIFLGWSGIDLGDLDASKANVTIDGTATSGHFGWDVSNAGDVNGDGYDDVVIGEPDNGTGAAYIFYCWDITHGTTYAYDTGDMNETFSKGESGDKFGASVSGVGDLDGNGYDDVVIGAPLNDSLNNDLVNAGAAYVVFGQSSSTAYTNVTSNTDTLGTTTNFANAQDADDSSAYATLAEEDKGGSGTRYATGSSTDSFADPANVEGGPNNLYPTISGGADGNYVSGSGYDNIGTGAITQVVIKMEYSVSSASSSDEIELDYLISGTPGATSYGYFAPTATSDTEITVDVTSDRSWTWADIGNLAVRCIYNREGGPDSWTISIDALYITIVAGANYKMDIEFTTINIPSGTPYKLDINYQANGEQFDVMVYNTSSSGWDDMGDLTSATMTTSTIDLYSNQYNGGEVRVRYVGKTESSDTSSSTLYVEYHRIISYPSVDIGVSLFGERA